MTVDFIKLILTTSSHSALIPLGLGIFRWKRLSYELKILSAYLLLSAIIDIISAHYAHRNINNLAIYYLFTFLEFIIFSYLYYIIYDKIRLKRLIQWIAILFSVFIIADVYIEGSQSYAAIPRTVESIIFTIYSTIYLYFVLGENENASLKNESLFWINGGVLVFFAGTLLFFSLSTFILANADLELQKKLFITPSILNIIQKILFTISIWISITRK